MQIKKSDKIKVGLVQINNSFSNQNYFPYSVGLLQGFAQRYLQNKDDFEFLLPIYKSIAIESALDKIIGSRIAFFSVYTWNLKISLEIARRLKENKSDVIVVFGGPEVPDENTEDFLRRYHFINIACHGEGENAFSGILQNYKTRGWKKVNSISYLDDKGNFIKNPLGERISRLDLIPSPYVDGVFNPLMVKTDNENWIALWETNRGCPFLCAYCVWGQDTQNRIYEHNMDKLFLEIDWFSKQKIEFVFCCDANFGILERDIELVRYFARNKQKYGYPKILSVQSSKNFTETTYKMYKIMADTGLSKGVSLSLQSLNPKTVRDIKRRNIPIESFSETQKRLSSLNVETFTDLILGLPSETYESFIEGVCKVIKNGQHNRIQFNNLSILTNSEMDEPQYQRRHGLNTVEIDLVNIHGAVSKESEIQEKQRLVVGTAAMPPAQWIKARVFAWMVSLLYFDKLLQVPFIILNKKYSFDFGDLIKAFMESKTNTSIFSEIKKFFEDKANEIQSGGSEFCSSEKWLNIWWPADELMLIKLCTENKLPLFYKEAEEIFDRFSARREYIGYKTLLQESLFLNQCLIKMPFQNENMHISLSHNIWEVYYSTLTAGDSILQEGHYCYEIDRTSCKWHSWEDWCREVVWYQHKKGTYTYTCRPQAAECLRKN